MTTCAARLLAASLAVLASGVLTSIPLQAQASTHGHRPTAVSSGASPHSPHGHVLDRSMRGRSALAALGSRASGVAAQNGLSRRHLDQVLTSDDTAWIAEDGQMFYREDAPAEAITDAPATAQAVTAPYPLAQTFSLHSRPGSSKVIFLDVNGGTVSGTGWNSGDTPMASGTYTGFTLDGDPSTFTDTERAYVQEVWREVAESYSPFDVDVTTQDPGTAAFTRASSTDQTFGAHVMITSQASARQQACGSCLGVAYVGTFDSVDPGGYYQPSWVFRYSTSFDPMIIAQAATHETGHTLGLTHDGTASASYYGGTKAWGPVMGSAMNRAVTQFSKGEYTGASNTQDDLAVIATNGLPLRADDHGNTTAAADQLGAHASYTATGVISTRSDQDVVALTLPCTTTLTASASGIGAQTALDLSLQVLDASGHVVATSAPTSSWSGSPPTSTGMNATVSVPGATGTYYLRVDGVGNGSAAAGGWSDYGSLGQYTLTATGCAEVPGGSDPTPTPTPSPTPTPTADPTPTPSPPPAAVTPRRPSAPRIARPSSGRRGGATTAVARWGAPSSTGSAPIRAYRVRALRLGRHSRVLAVYTSGLVRPTSRAVELRLPTGRYVFRVLAYNAVGTSPWSWTSPRVRSR